MKYGGNITQIVVSSLKKQCGIQIIFTTRITCLPSLKPSVDKILKSHYDTTRKSEHQWKDSHWDNASLTTVVQRIISNDVARLKNKGQIEAINIRNLKREINTRGE